MKKHVIFYALILLDSFCILMPRHGAASTLRHIVQDSLTAYTGKYELKRGDQVLYINVSTEKGTLVGTQSWDGSKKYLDHLSGDNFIVAGAGWSVKFIRDKDKKVSQMVVSGTDTWIKIKS